MDNFIFLSTFRACKCSKVAVSLSGTRSNSIVKLNIADERMLISGQEMCGPAIEVSNGGGSRT
jgi:hypothetical protein